jgi:hypothetical protein
LESDKVDIVNKTVAPSFITPLIYEIVDREAGYQRAEISTSSQFFGATYSRESDPTGVMTDAAEKIFNATKAAVIRGVVEIEGCDREVEAYLGKKLSNVDGREINLATYSDTSHYPLITEIVYLPQREKIMLALESTRN